MVPENTRANGTSACSELGTEHDSQFERHVNVVWRRAAND
jgi:hypothetical protein